MNKPCTTLVWSVFFLALILCGLVFNGAPSSVAAQELSNVTGVIQSDTVWSKLTGDINLTGNVIIVSGTTLTIKPGVNVKLNNHWLQVEGTLIAKGDNRNNSVTFEAKLPRGVSAAMSATTSAGGIKFSSSCTAWNESQGEGCTIKDAIFRGHVGIVITDSAPRIENTSGYLKIKVVAGSPSITENTIYGSINVTGGSPTITNNTIHPYFDEWNRPYSSGISLSNSNAAMVLDNFIHSTNDKSAIIVTSGRPIIARNLITNDDIKYGVGITIIGKASPLIENNTIALNSIGLHIYDNQYERDGKPIFESPSPTILYNNIENNGRYSICLGRLDVYNSTVANITATSNWWGTIDVGVINQTIRDFKNSIKLGSVHFAPILTIPNSEALPNPEQAFAIKSEPTPSPAPTPTPTPKPSPTLTPSSTNQTATGQPSPTESATFSTAIPAQSYVETLEAITIVLSIIVTILVGAFAATYFEWRQIKKNGWRF